MSWQHNDICREMGCGGGGGVRGKFEEWHLLQIIALMLRP
jgi:hypothetical protein